MLDTRETYPLSDFVSNPEAHVARLRETRTPQVLTVNGQAKGVLLDTETYEDLMEQINTAEEIAYVRAVLQQARCAGPREKVSDAEMERGLAVMRELVEETERLGLYQ